MQNTFRNSLVATVLLTAVMGAAVSAKPVTATPTPAPAPVATPKGINYQSSFSGKTLTLVIDATDPSGNFKHANSLIGLTFDNFGQYAPVAFSGPGAYEQFIGGTKVTGGGNAGTGNTNINSQTCATGNLCFFGSSAITAPMRFMFMFVGNPDLMAPAFTATYFVPGGGNNYFKDSTKLSPIDTTPAAIPVATVPEPGSLLLMAGALGLMGFTARKRRVARAA